MAKLEVTAVLDADGYMSVRQTADRLGMKPQSIYEAIYSKRLSAIRVGGFYLVHQDDANAFTVNRTSQRNGRIRHSAAGSGEAQ